MDIYPTLTFNIILFILGLFFLVFSAERFITKAVNIACISGAPKLLVGTLLIGICTSIPEIIVTCIAVYSNKIDLALGNILGSYVANIGLVLGLTAIVKPLFLSKDVLYKEIPILIITLAATTILLLDGVLSRIDGYLLLVLFALFIKRTISYMMKNKEKLYKIIPKDIKNHNSNGSLSVNIFMFFFYFSLVSIGSYCMVQSSVMIAKIANISDLTIGLSILAIGTSLPELTTSIISARKEEFDLVFGNIIGSNIVCLLFVLAIPAIFSSNPILTVDLWYELSIMVFITALLWLFSAKFDKELSINRLEGACLLLVFFIYIFQLSL